MTDRKAKSTGSISSVTNITVLDQAVLHRKIVNYLYTQSVVGNDLQVFDSEQKTSLTPAESSSSDRCFKYFHLRDGA